MSESSQPAYEDIEAALARAGAALDAAETQALMCGLFCASGRIEPAQWQPEVFGDDFDSRNVAVQQADKTLRRLAEGIRDALFDGELNFRLLLPADEAPLGDRAEALGAWCEAFLAGLGLGGVSEDTVQAEEVRDLLRDLSEIARAGLEGESGDEADEQAYAEIAEYVRVGVFFLCETLQPLSAPRHLQ